MLVGAGLGMTFAAIFTLTDVFESSSNVAALSISNTQLRVLGDDTYLSLNVKNVGTQSVTVTQTVLLQEHAKTATVVDGASSATRC